MTKNLGKVDEEKEGRHHEATPKTSWKLNITWAPVTALIMWVHFLTLRLPPLPSRGNKIDTDLQDTYGIIVDSEHRFVKCFKQKHMHAYTFNIYVDTGAWFREKITSCASIIFPIYSAKHSRHSNTSMVSMAAMKLWFLFTHRCTMAWLCTDGKYILGTRCNWAEAALE